MRGQLGIRKCAGTDFLHETRDATEINNLRFAFNSNDKIFEHLEDGQYCFVTVIRKMSPTSSTLSIGRPVHKATIFLHWYSFSALAP